jgi:HEAT repeat protein
MRVASTPIATSRENGMSAFCPTCWAQISAADQVCPACGADCTKDARSFQAKLISALSHPLPEARARICWILGQKQEPWAVPHLISMLKDEDMFVRVAALRALGEIADPAAEAAVRQAAADQNVMLRIVAQGTLMQIRTRNRA